MLQASSHTSTGLTRNGTALVVDLTSATATTRAGDVKGRLLHGNNGLALLLWLVIMAYLVAQHAWRYVLRPMVRENGREGKPQHHPPSPRPLTLSPCLACLSVCGLAPAARVLASP